MLQTRKCLIPSHSFFIEQFEPNHTSVFCHTHEFMSEFVVVHSMEVYSDLQYCWYVNYLSIVCVLETFTLVERRVL